MVSPSKSSVKAVLKADSCLSVIFLPANLLAKDESPCFAAKIVSTLSHSSSDREEYGIFRRSLVGGRVVEAF